MLMAQEWKYIGRINLKSVKRLKYILSILLLCLASLAEAKNFTLVVDAGHGGNDAGAVGAVSKEKNLTLKFALAFGRMVEQNCPDVKVIYTRKRDVFVPLWQRAEIANKAKADLFISVHINALPRGRVARGFQTYTLGTSKRTGKRNGVVENLEVAKRENSVILLEKDYQRTYQGYDPNSAESNIMFEFIQDKNMENSVELAKYMQRYVCQATGRQDMGAQQDNLAVLRLSSMPGCLVELGFISTRDEENFMNSKGAEAKYARGMFNAFLAYRKRHGSNITVPYHPEPRNPVSEAETEAVLARTVEAEPPVAETQMPPVGESRPAEVSPSASIPNKSASPVFKVQILVSSSKLKPNDRQFKGLSPNCYVENGVNKYTVGSSTDYQEVSNLRKQVASKFPKCFVIAFKNGQRMNLSEAIQEYKRNKVKKK